MSEVGRQNPGVQNMVEESAAAGVRRFIQCSIVGCAARSRTRRPPSKARRILDHQLKIKPEEELKEMVRSFLKACWL